MYKYIGTEQQLLNLGFDKLMEYGEYFWQTNNEIYCVYCAINIYCENNGVEIPMGNCDYVPYCVLKLFVDMVESGLIIWED